MGLIVIVFSNLIDLFSLIFVISVLSIVVFVEQRHFVVEKLAAAAAGL
jgi:hypothetical protein